MHMIRFILIYLSKWKKFNSNVEIIMKIGTRQYFISMHTILIQILFNIT